MTDILDRDDDVVFYHVDPHTGDSQANVVQSKFYTRALDREDDRVKNLIKEYIDVDNPNDLFDVSGYHHDYQKELGREFKRYVAEQSEIIDFIMAQCVPKIVGPVHDEKLLDLIRKHVSDSDQWEDRGFSRLVETGRSEGKPHMDQTGFSAGEFRVGFSLEKSTSGYDDWFIDDSQNPVPVNGELEDRKIEVSPATLMAWEAYSGVHSSPDISEEEIADFGGTRTLITTSYSFKTAIKRALHEFDPTSYPSPDVVKPQVQPMGRSFDDEGD